MIMDCLVLAAVSLFRRRGSSSIKASRLGYRRLEDDLERRQVTVVVGKDKKEFLVDPFVLEETPFRVLIDEQVINDDARKFSCSSNSRRRRRREKRKVIFVDVDAILFEHMLWLMTNDSSSLFQLNLKEIIDFYAQDY